MLAQLCVMLSPLLAAAATFDQFCDRLAAQWLRADPQTASALQYFTGAQQDALDRQLTPITKRARLARVAIARRGLAELRKFERSQLNPTQRISAAALEWQLDDIVRGESFADYAFVFQQYNGLQVQLVNFLTQTHPVRNRRDVENYLARLELIATQLDEGVVQARDRAARGIVPPRFIIVATIQQLDRFLSVAPSQNILITSLAERAVKLADLPAADRRKFLTTAEKIVSLRVIPAFRRAQALLREQLPLASEDAGLWHFPDGDNAYAQALRRFTTTDLSAAQIHELGLKEVARIEQQLDRLFRQLGYHDGSIQERMRKLDADSQPPLEPDPRAVLLGTYEEILRDAEQRADSIFDLRPKAPIVIKREPVFTEKNASAHYAAPAPDGSRPGIFWVPLPGPTFSISDMRTRLYHEAVPGHHFQVALQSEMTNLPWFRRDRVFGSISAHSEGWALYAEQLAAESGWYQGDLKGQLGQLNAELFRARRLVADTGLHAFHWARQQAIDYGLPASEVERYVVCPGQACSYKIGQLRILELRAKAQTALGKRFSLKEFHNLVLSTGSVPLAVLAQVVNDYVQSKSAPQ